MYRSKMIVCDMTKNSISQLSEIIKRGPPLTAAFQKFVLSYFRERGRKFPWRSTKDPYKILVSEVMLQQTQTERVIVKYREFLKAFPTWRALSKASPAEVVKAWSGLGYYRRAFNLHRAARCVCEELGGKPPRTAEELRNLPGVGAYTAAAVAAFAFGEAVPMIETNIRSVYLYTFFPVTGDVTDKEILKKIDETMYSQDPRAWFYALMDLGVELKKQAKGINHRSKHHKRQSKFEGSQRQVRAAVLKLIAASDGVTARALGKELSFPPEKIERALSDLEREGLIGKGARGRLQIAR